MLRFVLFLLLFLSTTLIVQSADFGLIDKVSYFNIEETVKINEACESIAKNYGVNLQIYTFNSTQNEPNFPKSIRNFSKFLFVKINTQKGAISTSTLNIGAFEAGVADRIFIQWCMQNVGEIGVFAGLVKAMTLYEKHLNDVSIAAKFLKQQKNEEEKLSSLTVNTLTTLILLVVWFIVAFTRRTLKSGNKFENTEFYGLSRLGFKGALTISVILIALIIAIYSNEWYVIIWIFPFAVYPLLVIVGSIYYMFADFLQYHRFDTQDIVLSVAQKQLLLKPNISTTDIIELNFFELLYRKLFYLKITSYESHRRIRHDYWLNVGYQHEVKVTDDLQPFLIKNQTKEKPLEDYFKRVHRNIKGFKKYRKEKCLTPLMYMGLIKRSSWLFNHVVLTEKGEHVRNQIMKLTNKQEEITSSILNDAHIASSNLPGLNINVLLLENFKETITELFNVLYQNSQVRQMENHRLSFLFDQNFDFDQFSRKHFQAYSFSLNWGSFKNLEEFA